MPQYEIYPSLSSKRSKRSRTFLELVLLVVIAFFIVIPIHFFVAQPFLVAGDSMIPTFHENDYLVIDRISYRFEKPARGEVVIFRYPLDPSFYFIKRIVGIPGDTVRIDKNVVTITDTNGVLMQSIIEPASVSLSNRVLLNATTTLARDEYFVLGDNGGASADSREWGPLQDKFIIGRALVRLWPLTKVGMFPGQDQ